MSQERTTLEIIAPSVAEAVEKGAAQLGLPEDALEVVVLDEGNRGFLGLGSRQARVRLSIKIDDQLSPVQPASSAPAKSSAVVEDAEEQGSIEELDDEDAAHALEVAEEVVQELLSKMKVAATVEARYIDPEDDHDHSVLLVDIHGKDLSILIGRRSETLNALQYIASLIVGKQLDRWIPLMIDVQGYRFRRESQLRKLARRMADQAVQSGRRQVLEPMPANERRLIHLELRENDQVVTQSVGDEPYRKVTILPKK